MKNLKEKIKTKSFWVSLAGAVTLLAGYIGRLCGFSINSDIIEGIIMAVCEVLIVIGFVGTSKTTNSALEDAKDKDTSNNNDENK